ncbi:hypothetical protein ABVK25_004162 [Lepraria finkii]|uniref:Uncharacterized protein n=1 Tax=Lepraria finkii TaxID=1340010 RepID=A0ABR4BEX3_9LECA
MLPNAVSGAGVEGSDGTTLIYYQASDAPIYQLKGPNPPVKGVTYTDSTIAAAGVALAYTLLAVTDLSNGKLTAIRFVLSQAQPPAQRILSRQWAALVQWRFELLWFHSRDGLEDSVCDRCDWQT